MLTISDSVIDEALLMIRVCTSECFTMSRRMALGDKNESEKSSVHQS